MQLGSLGECCKLPQLGLGGAPAEIKFGAFYPHNFGGSNFTNFPESCVGLTSSYGDKASINRFIFFLNRLFPFLPA